MITRSVVVKMKMLPLITLVFVFAEIFAKVDSKTTFVRARRQKDEQHRVFEPFPPLDKNFEGKGYSQFEKAGVDHVIGVERHVDEYKPKHTQKVYPQEDKLPWKGTSQIDDYVAKLTRNRISHKSAVNVGPQAYKGGQNPHVPVSRPISTQFTKMTELLVNILRQTRGFLAEKNLETYKTLGKETAGDILEETTRLNNYIENFINTFTNRLTGTTDICKELSQKEKRTFLAVLQCYIVKSYTALSYVELLSKNPGVADADARLLIQLIANQRSLSHISEQLSELAKAKEQHVVKKLFPKRPIPTTTKRSKSIVWDRKGIIEKKSEENRRRFQVKSVGPVEKTGKKKLSRPKAGRRSQPVLTDKAINWLNQKVGVLKKKTTKHF